MSEDSEFYGNDDEPEDDGLPSSYMHEVKFDAWLYDRGNWERLQIPLITLQAALSDEEDDRDHCEAAIEALNYERIAGSEPIDAVGAIQIFEKTDPEDEDMVKEPFAVSLVLGTGNHVVFATDLPSLVGLIRELEPLAQMKLQKAAWIQ